MLHLELLAPDKPFVMGEAPVLRARYRNDGAAPLALTFWWNRAMRVRAPGGAVLTPGPGPELPCGAGEDWHVLAPGESVERDEPLACTQPAGVSAAVGWRYSPTPGTWGVTLLYTAPPAHGFTQAEPHASAFVGSVESNEVTIVVTEAPGMLDRLKKIFSG